MHTFNMIRYFLVLFAGQLPGQTIPKALGENGEEDPNTIRYESERFVTSSFAIINGSEW